MEFYRRWPFDDLHRYHRPAALIAQKMAGGSIEPLLDFLAPPDVGEELGDVDLSVLRALGVTRHRG